MTLVGGTDCYRLLSRLMDSVLLSLLLVSKQSKPINAIGNPRHIFEAEVPGVCGSISGDRTSIQF